MPAAHELTQRQLLFWLGQRRHPDVPLYNTIVEFDIAGELDVGRFRRAISELVRSCDALRSVFTEQDGAPRRIVLGALDSELRVHDFSAERDPERAYRECVGKLAAQRFDLAERCFDTRLFKLAPNRYVWWFCQHHLIGDGASVGLIYRFVAERYADSPKTVLGSAREAESQERRYLTSERARADEAFWVERQKQTLERTPFYAQPRPERGRQVERLELSLDEPTSGRIRDLARRLGIAALPDLGVTCFFQSVLFAYLQRVTGRNEQAIGTPFRNRQSAAAKKAVGCFIEVVPVQVDVSPEEGFGALFRRVQDATIAALSAGQRCISNSDEHPLFEVSFNFLSEKYGPFAGFPTRATYSTGLHAQGPASENPLAYFPGGESLSVHCHDYAASGRFTLWFDFHAGRFDPSQRSRALGHFANLLRGVLDDIDKPLGAHPIVGDEERQTLLRKFNPAFVPEVPGASVVSLFEAQVERSPHAIAARFGEQTVSYRELSQRADLLARELRTLGVGPDVLVAILLERSLEVPRALLAVMKAGGAYVPLDPSHPAARNALVLEDARPKVVVTERALVGKVALPADARVVCVDELGRVPEAHALPSPSSEQLAYVLFTSGSTGRPKGVEITHGALANFLCSMQVWPGLSPDDRMLALTTVTFDIAGLELYLPLITGAMIELADTQTASDPSRLSALLDQRRPTVAQATPATWRMLLDTGWQGDPTLRVFCGGEALSPELAKKLGEKVGELWNLYGPTETTVYSTVERIEHPPSLPITIGAPIRNTTVYVLNEALELAPIGVIGEICIGGDGVARGYRNNAQLTQSRFLPDPYSSRPGDRIYKTGDLGRFLGDGRLECLGRSDFQVKLRGFRIELGEIESVLAAHPAVRAAVVIAREDRPSDKQLAAYVVAEPSQIIDSRELRAFVQERLPGYMVPATFTVLGALPLTPNGKVDRKALPKPLIEATSTSDPPRSDMELRVAGIFERLLGIVNVGRNDDFFDLGGHSLLAAQLLVQLNAISKSPIGVGQIFERRTVARLAELVASGGLSDAPLVIPLNRATEGTPLFCVCGIHLYRELAQTLGDTHPVYGVYLPAEERGIAEARSLGKIFSVEELASGYLEAIRKQQPKGPYCLAGVSFGGVLAYEIAQQLRAMGERVELLALFDSALPRAMRRRWARWVTAHARAALRSKGVDYVLKRVKRAFQNVQARHSRPPLSQVPISMQFRMSVYLEASRRYDRLVRPYTGTVKLFRATARDDFEGYDVDPTLGWGTLAPSLEIYEAQGSHLGILLEPGVHALAGPLRAVLDSLGHGTRDQAAAPGAPSLEPSS